ncbi:oxidoreductase [Streptomyces sp. NPDC094049]|uniref:oxidoreductase n=1 Tax=Streptomyces sp. NPDC094049 TaxID=3154987 RepID=UPI003316FAE3
MTIPLGPPYGYGHPPPPPPPKPGVIPLAPLGFGTVLTGAFSTVGRYWKQLLGVAAVSYVGALLVIGATVGIAYAVVGDHATTLWNLPDGQDARWEDVLPLIIGFGCVWAVAMLSLLCASTLVTAACPAVVQEAVLGRPTTFGTVWRRAWSRLPAVFGTVLLTTLALMLPLVLLMATFVSLALAVADSESGLSVTPLLTVGGALALTPLACWLWVKFSFAPAAAVIENQGALASMRRSSHLVRGSWWRLFACLLAAGLMAGVVGALIQQVFSLIASAPLAAVDFSGDDRNTLLVSVVVLLGVLAVGQAVGQGIVSVFPPLVAALLYVDQRIRKENLAADLVRAAGPS